MIIRGQWSFKDHFLGGAYFHENLRIWNVLGIVIFTQNAQKISALRADFFLGIFIFTQNVKKNWRFAPIFFLVYLFSYDISIFSIFFAQNRKISQNFGASRNFFDAVYLFSHKNPKIFACGGLAYFHFFSHILKFSFFCEGYLFSQG